MITLSILLAAGAALAAQEAALPNAGNQANGSAEAANGAAARVWQPLNSVALIVNEECLTSLDIQREVFFVARANQVPSDDLEQRRRLHGRVVSRMAGSMLEQQGGQDLGFLPEQVERLADDQLQREKERAGSISLLAEDLARREKDSLTLRTETKSYIYGRLHRDAATGRGASPGGRPSVDNHVRPGKLWFEYRNQLLQNAAQKQVQITQLLVAEEDLEATRAQAEELRQRILDGDDMGDLAERYGQPRGSRGQSELLKVNDLREPFRSFLSEAQVGDLSDVLPFERDGQVVGYIVLRVDEVKVPELPDFSEREYQRTFELRVSEALQQQLILEALDSLAKAAFVWPSGALGEAPSPPPGPPPQPEPAEPEEPLAPQPDPSQEPPAEPGQAPTKP